MDSLIAASARALSAGDPLGALKRVALRDDPPALALRGIAMAQLGELARARELLREAARGFGAHEALARARCVVAQAEVALALRDLGAAARGLTAAAAVLAAHGDLANAAHAQLIDIRRLVLVGSLEAAAAALASIETGRLPPALAALATLLAAELASRGLRVEAARDALARAEQAARRANVPALSAEVADAAAALARPAAVRIVRGVPEPVDLAAVAALRAGDAFVVDACRRGLHVRDQGLTLARRPILFVLLRTLAEAWPDDVDREALIARAFRTRQPDETHRARLRVEIGRLRALAAPFARIVATPRGFGLQPLGAREVVVLAPPIDDEPGALLALLADGAAWSTSALALAVGASQRQVQRELAELEATGRVRALGRGRAQRWLAAPLAGFTTILLLPAAPGPG
ncbi:helix-turn-helix domain-containing protein [Piscinibacter koreensis]|uniref:Helix-turn-helix domain-containing protein n=1 Tax=Piscinibacter koreensis TaxID=2742824 RepID=A0A7Y6NJF9_9BURK|nr:helix-turn-helix domain-containing protein [Schlegelella koreensis]NUZ04211.1 helix-turn-helix domain-containing protein [Schlegelella koreensis]